MWTKELLGTDVYHLVAAFAIYSVLGWIVESIYMSFCNKKLTNRGFMSGPFCPIYGVGAVVGYIILHPLADNVILLYIVGAVLATIFEFLVAKLMLRLFGEVWWDYNDKPYNYKGMVCLESTIAWGFYAVIIITFLFDKVMRIVDSYPVRWGMRTIGFIFVMAFIDFGYHFVTSVNVHNKMHNDEKIAEGNQLREK